MMISTTTKYAVMQKYIDDEIPKGKLLVITKESIATLFEFNTPVDQAIAYILNKPYANE